MREVDGSAGGGQILRSALSLSMLSGESVTVEAVRGDRSTPGLKAQHLAVVETAAAVCDADVEGAEPGSEMVTFDPGTPTGGRYHADIGTAGSVTLLFDTFLPLATVLDDPLVIDATGGTDVTWSPPTAFYRRVKLPTLREHGVAATVDVDRTGFYPAGGGSATLRVWPSAASPLELAAPGGWNRARVYSTASDDLADAEVAERQAAAAVEGLDADGVSPAVDERAVTYVDSASTGSVLVVQVDGEVGRAGFTAFGEPGKPAEDVAADAVGDAKRVLGSAAAVDEHSADQLLVFLAMAGGAVAIPRMTDHVESSLAILETFGFDVSVENGAEGDEAVILRRT